MQEFVIQCRYEYRSFNGVCWTEWFVVDSNHYTENSVKDAIKNYAATTKQTDRITKLKHEYRQYDAGTYEKEYIKLLSDVEVAKEEFAKIPRMKKPWKRKKKKV